MPIACQTSFAHPPPPVCVHSSPPPSPPIQHLVRDPAKNPSLRLRRCLSGSAVSFVFVAWSCCSCLIDISTRARSRLTLTPKWPAFHLTSSHPSSACALDPVMASTVLATWLVCGAVYSRNTNRRTCLASCFVRCDEDLRLISKVRSWHFPFASPLGTTPTTKDVSPYVIACARQGAHSTAMRSIRIIQCYRMFGDVSISGMSEQGVPRARTWSADPSFSNLADISGRRLRYMGTEYLKYNDRSQHLWPVNSPFRSSSPHSFRHSPDPQSILDQKA